MLHASRDDRRKSFTWTALAGGLSAVVVAAALIAGWGWARRAQRFTGSEFVMDTLVSVTVYGPQAAENGRAALDEFRRLDRLLSAYLPDSDVGRVNAAAGREAVRVSRETAALVALSLKYAALSGGRFDPTVGPLVRLWGVGEGRTEPPSPVEIAAARRLVDYRRVMVDQAEGRLYLPQRGMALDLGGVAKGYAADRAAAALRARGVSSALIDAGGNIVALGTRPGGRPWRIGIRHPRREGQILGVLSVADRAVVTSGDYERFFLHGGRRYHHILDSHTGRPAEGFTSVTIVAPSSTLADLLSTAVFVLGPKDGPAFARRHGAETLTVSAEGAVSVSRGLLAAWTPRPEEPRKGGDES